MNNELFNRARALYQARDYQGALSAFSQCLQDGARLAPGEMGLLYHQIGNCLIKLKDPGEAIHAYTQATADASYDACGSVNYNLGMAYAALHDYENAVRHFEISVSDAKYDTPYKAYIGMGNALMKLGKSAEAGVAFREAALDERGDRHRDRGLQKAERVDDLHDGERVALGGVEAKQHEVTGLAEERPHGVGVLPDALRRRPRERAARGDLRAGEVGELLHAGTAAL